VYYVVGGAQPIARDDAADATIDEARRRHSNTAEARE
jgi:hypothetical protein